MDTIVNTHTCIYVYTYIHKHTHTSTHRHVHTCTCTILCGLCSHSCSIIICSIISFVLIWLRLNLALVYNIQIILKMRIINMTIVYMHNSQ